MMRELNLNRAITEGEEDVRRHGDSNIIGDEGPLT